MIKKNLNIKLFNLKKIFLIYFSLCVISYASDININNDLIVIGEDNAPVKIKVFSSLTCPHCANFHIKVIFRVNLVL